MCGSLEIPYPPTISELPPELLSKIFALALPRRSLRHIIPFEVRLSHVSPRWRTVALSDPALWTTIEIYSPSSLERASAYIKRSGTSLPLNLRVELHEWDGRVLLNDVRRDPFLQSICVLLQTCLHRAVSLLLFTFHDETVYHILSQLLDQNASKLERFRIKVEDNNEIQQNFSMASPILKAGSESLHFLETETLKYLPPVNNLVTLHLQAVVTGRFAYDDFLQLFRQTTSLQHLSMAGRGYFPDWPFHVDVPAFTMKSLRALQVSEELPGFATKFLLSVHAPHLESIWLCCSIDNFGRFFESQQMNSGTSKFPKLRYLTLESYNMHETKRLAAAFPTITHLHLPYTQLFHFKHFADVMVTEPLIWPDLDTLVLTATRELHAPRLKAGLCRILPRRAEMNVMIPRLLTDKDLIHALNKGESDLLGEYLVMEELGTKNYQEPWWVMSHEETMDRIGLT